LTRLVVAHPFCAPFRRHSPLRAGRTCCAHPDVRSACRLRSRNIHLGVAAARERSLGTTLSAVFVSACLCARAFACVRVASTSGTNLAYGWRRLVPPSGTVIYAGGSRIWRHALQTLNMNAAYVSDATTGGRWWRACAKGEGRLAATGAAPYGTYSGRGAASLSSLRGPSPANTRENAASALNTAWRTELSRAAHAGVSAPLRAAHVPFCVHAIPCAAAARRLRTCHPPPQRLLAWVKRGLRSPCALVGEAVYESAGMNMIYAGAADICIALFMALNARDSDAGLRMRLPPVPLVTNELRQEDAFITGRQQRAATRGRTATGTARKGYTICGGGGL